MTATPMRFLIKVEQTGNACHTGAYSCFFNAVFDDQEAQAGQEVASCSDAANPGVSADSGSSVFGELYATVIGRKTTLQKAPIQAISLEKASTRSSRRLAKKPPRL